MYFKKHPQNIFFFKENHLPFVDFDGFFKWEFTSSKKKTQGLGGESTRVSGEFSDSTLSFQVIAFVHSLMNTCGTWGKNSSCGCMPRTGHSGRKFENIHENDETGRNSMNNKIFEDKWMAPGAVDKAGNGRFLSHDANSTTQRPSKGTCDTATSSCRCRKPITTLLATVCIDTGSLRDRRCEMPRWWWICWTGLFCEESQWKHRISVRLKLSKLQFGIWFAMSLFWGLFVSLRSFRWNTATGAAWNWWMLRGWFFLWICEDFDYVHAHVLASPLLMEVPTTTTGERLAVPWIHADRCKSISRYPLCPSAGSIDFFILTLASTYRVRRTEEVKTPWNLKHISWKSSSKFRHPPNSNQPNLRNSGDDPVPWQLAATPTTWFSLSSTEGTVPPRSFSRKFAWKSWMSL